MPIVSDYEERVYAGVLGKIIGVYLGRPVENWSYEGIMERLGEIEYYIHDKLNVPLIVTDDDISGTFTFLRALPDYGNTKEITAEQIGQTWLNYLIENRTVLWWGGLGNSTEHTAYLRLKNGIPAPKSGSMALNGQVVAEQIGAQIFIDGWGMVAPGEPDLAAELARRAASVSHDGEAIYAAQVVAALVAQGFVESDMGALLDTATSLIPKDSLIFRLIADLREWRIAYPDWRKARELLSQEYGYDKYGGNCHVIPNHGLIILSLLYGDDDFQRSLMIVNTCGWDTDCNSGNVGCILGVKNGLAGIEAGPDWRGPVNDMLYLPTADGGRSITDAVTETYHVVNIGRALAGADPVQPKEGVRFHFSLPGSTQGFKAETAPDVTALCNIHNVTFEDRRVLAIEYRHVTQGQFARVLTPTFIPPEAKGMTGYGLLASPTIYPGQVVKARVIAAKELSRPVACRLFIRTYGKDDALATHYGPEHTFQAGEAHAFTWQVPDTKGAPIAQIGLEIASDVRADGTLYLDYMTWDGAPTATFIRPPFHSLMWERAWTNAVDYVQFWPETYRLVQNRGTGLLIQGTREWTDYTVEADVTPHLVTSAGLAARVQGLKRYYALLLVAPGKVRLVKELDGEQILGEIDLPWAFGQTLRLQLTVEGSRIRAFVDGKALFDVVDTDRPLDGGAIALVCQEGRTATQQVKVRPVE